MFKLIYALLLFTVSFAINAQIVDTWKFNSPEEQEYALNIASQLRCPQCQNQHLLESNAPSAVSMRHQVFKMVAEGKDQAQIMSYMTDRYGDFVLYNPPLTMGTFVLWGLPLCLFILVLAILWRIAKKKKSEVQLIEKPALLTSQIEVNPPFISVEAATNHHTGPRWNRYINRLMLMTLILAITSYFLLPRFILTYDEYQRRADPLLSFSALQQEQNDLLRLQNDIRNAPKNGELWATLGEYYLYQNSYDNALIAYQKAIKYTGENAELFSAIATVLYYQAGQHITDKTQVMIDKALSLDKNEVTALMLLASDAFMNANYDKAINIWQNLLDSNNSRLNRTQLIEAIHMAKLMQGN